jgi:hypothetical protein
MHLQNLADIAPVLHLWGQFAQRNKFCFAFFCIFQDRSNDNNCGISQNAQTRGFMKLVTIAIQNNTASAVPKFYFFWPTVTIRQNYSGANHCPAICGAFLMAIAKSIGYCFACALLTCVFFPDKNNVIATACSFLLKLGSNAFEMSRTVGLSLDAVALGDLLDRTARKATRFAFDAWVNGKFSADFRRDAQRSKDSFKIRKAHGFVAEVDCRENSVKI